MTDSIDRVEVLKGTQSSLYGSGALAGTVQLFSKKGREGHNKDANISKGSYGTEKIDFSFDGKNDYYDYFIGYTQFTSEGESAMRDNAEKDGYRSDNLTMNYGYNLNDNFRLENYLTYTDTLLNYDAVYTEQTDLNTATDDQKAVYSARLIHEDGKLKNTLFYNNTYVLRNTTNYLKSKTNYYGYRDAVNLLTEYNFDLDNKIIVGFDNEFDKSEQYNYYTASSYSESDEAIFSQYFDLQLRPREKTHTTFGLRRDYHTTAKEYYSGRVTVAHKLDNNTKLRTNIGTGVRFPSLYTYNHGHNLLDKDSLKAETGKSIDVGVDKNFPENNLKLSATTFFLEYKNDIKGWKSHTGGKEGGWTLRNSSAKTESYGLELQTDWKPSDDYIFNLGYTRTESYDGPTCDNPDAAQGVQGGACLDNMTVRVPRHQINLQGTKIFSNNLSSSLRVKAVGERRDYGSQNNEFMDVTLSRYFVADLVTNYKLFDTYNLNVSAKNILGSGHETVYEYKAPSRSLNFRLGRTY
jgi:vitamin B12 transporter